MRRILGSRPAIVAVTCITGVALASGVPTHSRRAARRRTPTTRARGTGPCMTTRSRSTLLLGAVGARRSCRGTKPARLTARAQSVVREERERRAASVLSAVRAQPEERERRAALARPEVSGRSEVRVPRAVPAQLAVSVSSAGQEQRAVPARLEVLDRQEPSPRRRSDTDLQRCPRRVELLGAVCQSHRCRARWPHGCERRPHLKRRRSSACGDQPGIWYLHGDLGVDDLRLHVARRQSERVGRRVPRWVGNGHRTDRCFGEPLASDALHPDERVFHLHRIALPLGGSASARTFADAHVLRRLHVGTPVRLRAIYRVRKAGNTLTACRARSRHTPRSNDRRPSLSARHASSRATIANRVRCIAAFPFLVDFRDRVCIFNVDHVYTAGQRVVII